MKSIQIKLKRRGYLTQNLNTELYVLRESDGRFGLEIKPLNELFDKAVWNTTEDNPTLEWYLNKQDKRKGE